MRDLDEVFLKVVHGLFGLSVSWLPLSAVILRAANALRLSQGGLNTKIGNALRSRRYSQRAEAPRSLAIEPIRRVHFFSARWGVLSKRYIL